MHPKWGKGNETIDPDIRFKQVFPIGSKIPGNPCI